jgi:serine/threonine protein kinase
MIPFFFFHHQTKIKSHSFVSYSTIILSQPNTKYRNNNFHYQQKRTIVDYEYDSTILVPTHPPPPPPPPTSTTSSSPLPTPTKSNNPSHLPNSTTILKFKSLDHYIKTKNTIDDSTIKQTMTIHGYKPIRYLGKGRFGRVFLAHDITITPSFSPIPPLRAVKILNIERDRREYNWTWMTAEERIQSQHDASKLHQFIQSLPQGVVKDHMQRAEQLLLDTLKKEENPLLRRVRRPVAEREILLRIGPHPYVANLITSFRDARFMFLVFDYFEGGNLQSLVHSQPDKRLSEPLAAFFSAQLLLALELLSQQNVTHRDVKPGNLLLSRIGFCALADFGLATRLKGGLKTFCGTAEYIAPEVLSEKMWSAAYLDLWSFGCTLYFFCSGKTPFEGPDATSVFLNTLTSPLIFPSYFSSELKDLLTSVLSRDYSKRPTLEAIKLHPFFQHHLSTFISSSSSNNHDPLHYWNVLLKQLDKIQIPSLIIDYIQNQLVKNKTANTNSNKSTT